MKAVKNLFVIVGLIGVGYGLFIVLNKPQDKPLPGDEDEHVWGNELEISVGTPGGSFEGATGPVGTEEGNSPGAPQPWMGPDAASTASTPDAATNPNPGGSPPAFSAGAAPAREGGSAPSFGGAPTPEIGPPSGNWDDPDPATLGSEGPPPLNTERGPSIDPGIDAVPARQAESDIDPHFQPEGLFGKAWLEGKAMIREERYGEALYLLSQWHPLVSENPRGRLSENDLKHLVAMLDYLAYKVIYSPESYTDRPYVTVPGDTLESIVAQGKYKVPWQLIGQINGMDVHHPSAGSRQIPAGTPLKVLSGPIHAVVSIERGEMTLVHSGQYAARFPVRVGRDFVPTSIAHLVRYKENPGDAGNGFQRYVLNLNEGFRICNIRQGDMNNPDPMKTIDMTPKDAQDVFSILSRQSEVRIVR